MNSLTKVKATRKVFGKQVAIDITLIKVKNVYFLTRLFSHSATSASFTWEANANQTNKQCYQIKNYIWSRQKRKNHWQGFGIIGFPTNSELWVRWNNSLCNSTSCDNYYKNNDNLQDICIHIVFSNSLFTFSSKGRRGKAVFVLFHFIRRATSPPKQI